MTNSWRSRLESTRQRSEEEITSHWRVQGAPVVSVCCPTYNHEDYIEEAILGILAQETEFPFELIIRDDASTDRTSEIVRSYAARYPNIIRAVINPSNRFREGEEPTHVWPTLVRGQYIAFCDGDDFWIAKDKLAKQVRLLERHPSAVMAVARTDFWLQEGSSLRLLETHPPAALTKELLDLVDVESHYFHTSSYLIRSWAFELLVRDFLLGQCLFGDTAWRYILISKGPFALLPEVVSVYRKTGAGVWTSLDRNAQLKWEFDVAARLAQMLPGIYGHRLKLRTYDLGYERFKVLMRGKHWSRAVQQLPVASYYRILRLANRLVGNG